MEWDDDSLDDEPARPLLPPDDRLWRHPSEMAGSAPSRPQPTREPRLLTVAGLSSCISVLITLGVVALVSPLRGEVRTVERVIEAPATVSSNAVGIADVAAVAERMVPAIAQVVAEFPEGTVRGSGVIWHSDGLVLTAHHVVADAQSFHVVLNDGTEVAAELVGSDRETDVALLDLEGDGFPTAPLGSTSTVKVGHPAITIGTRAEASPAGPIVTFGVVSALNQQVDAFGTKLLDMIQTDEPVSPGCSGGAVIDANGAVIGIASTNAGEEAGLVGYATPIDVARAVAEELLRVGRIRRAWLGIEADPLPVEQARTLAVKGGALITGIKPGSPAHEAGLRVQDVIISIDGERVTSMPRLLAQLRAKRPGDVIVLEVLRGTQRQRLRVALGERDPA